MKRRTVLVGLGAAAGGGALATGAFDSATAERTATIGLADDANAFLALEPLNDDFAFIDDDGELGIVFDEVEGGGTGFGSNTVYDAADVFEVRNQGTEEVGLFAEIDDDSLGDADFDLLVNGEPLGPDPTVALDVGHEVPVGVRIDAGDDPTDGEVTITIGADTEIADPPADPPVEGTVGSLSFYSSASQRAPDGTELADDDVALVRGEPSAFNFESSDGPPPVIYEDNDVPLVSQDTTDPVVGFGTPEFVADSNGGFQQRNEQFLVNLFDDLIGPDATIAWDESHSQFWDLGSYHSFRTYAEDQGYDLQASQGLITGGGSLTLPSTASQVAPGGDAALTDPSRILVWAESTATNADAEGDGAYIYDDGTDIPVVSREGDVVGFGTPELIEDGELIENNEQFAVNLLADTLGPSGTVLWDDAHDTFFDSGGFGEFADAIEAEGYTFESSGDELLSTGEALVADPATPNATATHTWTLEDVEFGEPGNDGDEVDTITVAYPEGTSLDGLTNDDVTVTMTRTLSGGEDTSEISVNAGDYSGSEATFNLSGASQTDVAGPIEIVVDGVENPATGEYEASATLEGDADPVTETVDLAIGDDAGGSGTIDADAVAIASPADPYTDAELAALSDFVADGGTVWLFDESEFNNEETDNLNEIADELSLDFAFNPDQVEDDENNAGIGFVPTTSNFNDTAGYGDVFEGIGSIGLPDADGVVITTPAQSFTDDELDALEGFVADGGAAFLLDQSDFSGFDETENFNEIADALDLDFRFNSDQVNDEESNVGPEFDVLSENYDVDPDDPGVFAEREQSLAVQFESDGEYFGNVVQVFDGDTFEVEFDSDYGYRDVIRNIGIDTAETGGATNEPEEWFGIPDDALDHLDEWGGNATDFALDVMAPEGADAGEEDIEGRRVKMTFDEREPLRGNFGRLLMFMDYDPDEFDPDPGDGEFSVDYNKETVEEGYARVYSSGFARHDEFAEQEEAALADGTRVWSASDFDALDEIRNDGYDEVFVPRASSITSTAGPIDDDRVVLPAASTAEQEPLPDEDGLDEYDQPPLVATDESNGVAMVGGVLVHERYEAGEGAGVGDGDEPESFGNFPLFTNVADDLSTTTGDVIIEGGHGQFDIPGSVPLERVQFYLRFVEGLGGRLRQINDVVETLPAEAETPRAVFLTAPDRPYTDDELDALVDYRDAGGAVVLVGSAVAPASARANLNDIADALGTDLRLNGDQVVDDDSNLADTPEFPVSSEFDPNDPLFGPASLD